MSVLSELLSTTLPVLLSLVRKDVDRQLVIAVLEQLKAMLDNIKTPLLYDQTITDEIISIIKIVIHRKVGAVHCCRALHVFAIRLYGCAEQFSMNGQCDGFRASARTPTTCTSRATTTRTTTRLSTTAS